MNISLFPNATEVEQFAAWELERYLSLALEQDVPYTFVLTRANDLPGPEGMRIRITEDTVELSGTADGKGRGLLYAVYEFLERYLGCCFGAYCHPDVPGGEVIPTHDNLHLPREEYVKAGADLPYRTAIVQFDFWAGNADRGLTLSFIDWLAKNRYNRILTWVSCYEQLIALGFEEELKKRGIYMSVGHHQAISTWLPPYGSHRFPTAYALEHPEFYRLLPDGSRYQPKDPKDYHGQLCLCCRSEACIETVANNALSWLEGNPLVDTIAFWPHDGMNEQCCCEACAPYSKTENYLYFENQLALRIRAKRPEVKVDVLVYQDLWECPENVTLSDGILIDLATWAKTGMRPCGKPDGSALVGSSFEKVLMDYHKKGCHGVYYDYYMGNFANRQKLMPAADEMQSIFRNMVQLGLDGSGTQMECFNHWNNLLNFYCFARTAYDTGLSLEDNLSRFVRLFGEGSTEMAEILRHYEKTLDGQVPIRETGNFFIMEIDRESIYTLFDKALSHTVCPTCRNNIRMMRMAFRYSHLATVDAAEDRGLHPTTFEDPTGELAYMATHFDSYYANHTGYGIALPVVQRTDAPAPNHWYEFDR